MEDASSKYWESQIKTSNQGKLIVILYEAAIRFLKIAIKNIPTKKYDIVNNYIIKVQDIISELMLALNFQAGNFAKNLQSLYIYINKRLIQGNIKKDKETFIEIINYLEELKKAWEKISNISSPNDENDINNSDGINIKS